MSNLILNNVENGIKEGNQNTLALQILELEEEIEAMALESKNLRAKMLQKMIDAGIKSINTKYGSFQAIEKKNIKVDKKQAEIYLDSIGDKDAFMKLDETKVKKTFHNPDSNDAYNFIEVKEPTVYLAIKQIKA